MSFLSENEKDIIQFDIKTIIESTGETAKVLRPSVAQNDSFYGERISDLTEIAGSIPCESQDLSPDDIQMKNHDLIMNVLPDADVTEDDFIVSKGFKYRVSDIITHNCFGCITHLELKLEKDKRN